MIALMTRPGLRVHAGCISHMMVCMQQGLGSKVMWNRPGGSGPPLNFGDLKFLSRADIIQEYGIANAHACTRGVCVCVCRRVCR